MREAGIASTCANHDVLAIPASHIADTALRAVQAVSVCRLFPDLFVRLRALRAFVSNPLPSSPPSTIMFLTMLKRTALSLLIAVLAAAPAAAQHTIFLVRHAERADTAPGASPTMAADPDLSEAGRARAESLATALKDAKITAIYATEVQAHTADRGAARQGPGPDGQRSSTSRAARRSSSSSQAAKGNVLVVGHSNTVPDVIKGLGVDGAGDDRRRRVRQPVHRHDRYAPVGAAAALSLSRVPPMRR